MRHNRRSPRRVRLTRRVITVAVLTLLALLAPSVVTASGDDYPSRLKNAAQDSLVDPWLFYNRECTSFVAWRLNHDNNVDFYNYWRGVHWGDASNWKYAADHSGVTTDDCR